MADAALMHAWRNDERIRHASRRSEPISFDDHVAWLDRVLRSDDSLVLIALKGDRAVGVVRFEREDEQAEVSIYLDTELAGMGLGAAVLEAGERFLAETPGAPVTLIAETLPKNLASQRLFMGAGYESTGNRFRKRLNPGGNQL